MKKNIMIFLSAILVIMTLIIPSNVVRATYENEYNVDEDAKYQSFIESSATYFERLNEVIEGIQHLTTDYDIFIFTGSNSNYNTNVYLLQKYDSVDYGHFYFKNGSDIWFQTYARNPNGLTTRFYSTSFQLKVSDFSANSIIDSIEQYISISSNVRTNKSHTHDIWRGIATNNSLLYYSSADITYGTVGYTTTNNYEKLKYTSNNETIYNGENYLPYYNNIPGINISTSFMCDINGKEMEQITIDFSKFLNGNYKYQYGIKRHVNSDIVWHDISELTNGTYLFNEYYDGTYIYGRVLDNNDNVVSKNQIQITNNNMPKFEMIITSSLVCPIPNYDGDPVAEVIRIDITNSYSDKYIYEYSYNARVFHEIDIEEGKFIYELREYFRFHYHFRIKDENGNVIYQTFGNRTTDDLYELDQNRGKIFISEATACDLQNNKIINITMDFSNITKFTNEYDFDVVINGVHYGAIQYHQITLNRENYTQFYEIQIYIDGLVEFSTKYTVGYLIDHRPIQGTFDEMTFDEMYDKLIDNNIEDLEMNVKDLTGMKNLVLGFFRMIYSFIGTFFDLAIYFFNCLNVWLRACIISLLIIFLITKIIKAARK